MAKCVITAHYPNQIDITKTTLAFGDRAVPRLNRELKDETLLTRQRGLRTLCDYLHDPEHIATCIREGITLSLKGLLKDEDSFVRYKAAECLYVFSCNSNGRTAIVEQDIITDLAVLFDDSVPIARKNAHQTVEMCSEVAFGADGIVQLKLIKKLVDKLKDELDEIKEFILDTLHFCMMTVDTSQALEAEALKVFTTLLKHQQKSIKAKAARNVFDICLPLQGKEEALKLNTVPVLVDQLLDQDPFVKAKTALAIEAIAITTKGKYAFIQAGVLPNLVILINDELSELRVNSLKAISCLAEAPEARRTLTKEIEDIAKLIEDPVPIVAKHAEIAHRVITWKP